METGFHMIPLGKSEVELALGLAATCWKGWPLMPLTQMDRTSLLRWLLIWLEGSAPKTGRQKLLRVVSRGTRRENKHYPLQGVDSN